MLPNSTSKHYQNIIKSVYRSYCRHNIHCSNITNVSRQILSDKTIFSHKYLECLTRQLLLLPMLPLLFVLCLCHSFHQHYWHTHLFNGPFPGLPRWAGTRKVKPIWILLKQETVSGSGISWDICKSAPRSRQITTPTPHHSVFLHAGCPSCRPTNSVKALKAPALLSTCKNNVTNRTKAKQNTNKPASV